MVVLQKPLVENSAVLEVNKRKSDLGNRRAQGPWILTPCLHDRQSKGTPVR